MVTPVLQPSPWFRRSAFALGAALALLYLALLLLGKLDWGRGGFKAYDWLFVVGGPAATAVFTLVAVRWERLAGAFLWLFGAVAAAGIAWEAGPRLGQYFLNMGLFVAPQVLEGTLFLLHAGRTRPKPKPPRRTRA